METITKEKALRYLNLLEKDWYKKYDFNSSLILTYKDVLDQDFYGVYFHRYIQDSMRSAIRYINKNYGTKFEWTNEREWVLNKDSFLLKDLDIVISNYDKYNIYHTYISVVVEYNKYQKYEFNIDMSLTLIFTYMLIKSMSSYFI